MKLTSNIAVVISRLQELQAGYPIAVRRALAPEWWTPQLKKVAVDTLGSHARQHLRVTGPEFEKAIEVEVDRFIGTIYGTPVASGSEFGGTWMDGKVANPLMDAVQKKLPGTGTGKFDALNIVMENWPEFERTIEDWVAEQKDWDIKRDGVKTWDNVVRKADWITTFLVSDNVSTKQQDLRDSFLEPQRGRGILEFLDQRAREKAGTPAVQVDVATVRQWLGAVLAAWVSFVRDNLRDRIEAELKRLHAKVKVQQPELI